MSNTVQLEIITPNKSFYEGEVESIVVKTDGGYEGFLPNHTWACKLLDTGVLKIREPGEKEEKKAAISGGYIDVRDRILIFTDAAEWSWDIDIQRATHAKATIEDWLASTRSKNKLDIDQAKLYLAREIVRMSIGGQK